MAAVRRRLANPPSGRRQADRHHHRSGPAWRPPPSPRARPARDRHRRCRAWRQPLLPPRPAAAVPPAEGGLRRRLRRARLPDERLLRGLGPVPDPGRLPGRPRSARRACWRRASPCSAPVPSWRAWRRAIWRCCRRRSSWAWATASSTPPTTRSSAIMCAQRRMARAFSVHTVGGTLGLGGRHRCWSPASPPSPPGAWRSWSAAASAWLWRRWCSPIARSSRRRRTASRRTSAPAPRSPATCACSVRARSCCASRSSPCRRPRSSRCRASCPCPCTSCSSSTWWRRPRP